MEILFWSDPEKRLVDPCLYSVKAEEFAKERADECEQSRKKVNKRTQIRKFYDEVIRLKTQVDSDPELFEALLPQLHMLVAKAAYANGRNLVSNGFLKFIKDSVQQTKNREDLEIFANFFEAFMGFYRQQKSVN